MTTAPAPLAGRREREGPAGEPQVLLVGDLPQNLLARPPVRGSVLAPIVTAGSGEEALALMLRRRYAVVVLDVHLPDMDGFEIAVRMRALHQARDVPVIFVAAADQEASYAARAYQSGAADYLTKPIDPGALVSKVGVFFRLECERVRTEQALAHLRATCRRNGLLPEHLARHDPLTGLADRALLHDFLAGALARARRRGCTIALLFIDLADLGQIDDALGHPIGDRLVRRVTRALKRAVRAGDLVARLGGDEFAVVLDDLERREHALATARKLPGRLAMPLRLDEQALRCRCSIGVALYSGGAESVDDLLAHAASAMYEAKRSGRDRCRLFGASREQGPRLPRPPVASGIERALDRHELDLFYQPQFDAAGRRVVGLEALLRWHHPQRGLVGPEEFIARIERTGQILAIGQWVLRRVARQAGRWWRDGLLAPSARIAVNLSRLQLCDANLGLWIGKALRESGLSPGALEIELTESAVMAQPDVAAGVLGLLRESGVHIALDDFGTGHCSLSCLHRFPIETLKVDGSFVRGIGNRSSESRIKLAIILGHELGLRVVGEGVEHVWQMDFLRRHGCDALQGFYLCRPLPATEVEPLLARAAACSD